MKFIARSIAAALCLSTTIAIAQDDPAIEVNELVKVDGMPITKVHFAVFNAQQRAAGKSVDDQIGVLTELVNTFIVANSDEAKALEKLPEIAAALEVSRARLLAETLVRDTLQSAPVTDEELQARYKADYVDRSLSEFKARHILLETQDAATAVIEKLKQGADFAELAKTESTGPSKSVGGDLGWFSADQMVPEFSAAVAQMADKAFSSEPVQTQFGWHVILREESRDKAIPAMAEIKDQLMKVVRQEKVAALVNEIRNRANIEIMEVNQPAK